MGKDNENDNMETGGGTFDRLCTADRTLCLCSADRQHRNRTRNRSGIRWDNIVSASRQGYDKHDYHYQECRHWKNHNFGGGQHHNRQYTCQQHQQHHDEERAVRHDNDRDNCQKGCYHDSCKWRRQWQQRRHSKKYHYYKKSNGF
jgi:hypothetical protein